MKTSGPRPPWPVRAVAWLILRLYPSDFRDELAPEYHAAVAHRWRAEGGTGGGAAWRTVLVLLADAAHAVPTLRRRTGRGVRYVSLGPLDALSTDLRLALRAARRRPGFAALVVATLALGLGAHTAIFGVLDRFILHPLPFENGDRMVLLSMRSQETGFQSSPSQDFLERWRRGATTLDGIEVFREGSALVPGPEAPERIRRMEVSTGLATLLGVRPLLGRVLGAHDGEPGAAPAVMLGERYWRRAYGGDRGVVGGSLVLNDTLVTIVGVWPARATVDFDDPPAVFTPLPRDGEVDPGRFSSVLALLAAGSSPGLVESELTDLVSGLPLRQGTTQTWTPAVRAPYDRLGHDFVTGVWVAWIGVALLLVVAVVNAANLLLNRAVDREAELGVRLALGAPGLSVVRLFLVEALLLTAAGSALGMVMARWGIAGLSSLAPARFPDLAHTVLEPRALGYAGAVAIVTALVCGLVPSLHLRAPAVRGMLTTRGATERIRPWGLRSALVTVQVGLALVLAVGAGLGVRSFRALHGTDPGFDLRPLVIAEVSLPASRYPVEEDRRAFWQRAEEALHAIPGVEGVATSGVPPFSFSILPGEPYLVGDAPPVVPDGVWTSQASAAPTYFGVMGIPILEGTGILPEHVLTDDGVTQVVVNQAFASRYASSVVGRTLAFPESEHTMRIVGVAGNVRAHGLDDDAPRAQYWVEDSSRGDRYQRFLLRTHADPAIVLDAVRARVRDIDPALDLAGGRTGPQILRAQTENERFLAVLLAIFGAISLVVAMLGVYGSVSLAVSRRAREIGVRRVLGAATVRVVREVLGTGMRPVGAGLIAGVAGAYLLGRVVAGALYQVGPTDPLSYLAAVGLLGASGVAACLVPARRATRLDPVETLRSE